MSKGIYTISRHVPQYLKDPDIQQTNRSYRNTPKRFPKRLKSRILIDEHSLTYRLGLSSQELLERSKPKKTASKPNLSGNPSKTVNSTSINSIVKVELLEKENKEQVTNIWTGHFLQKEDCISAVVEPEAYEKLYKKGLQYPSFVLPLQRSEQGVEFYFVQFSGDQIYLTSLLEFKTFGSNATPHLVINHYTEFKETKSIVLMMGQVQRNPVGSLYMTSQEAQYLTYLIQLFYLIGSKENHISLLETFHKNPMEFDYEKLIESASKLK